MDILPLLGIAFGLAMDAFSVSIASGVTLGVISLRQTFRLSFHFGLFQFLMPVIGWLAGTTVAAYVSAYDHWLAFGLLAYVGGHMIWSALHHDEQHGANGQDPTKGISLVVLSVATSIDALAVGFSLALVGTSVWMPAVLIGLVAGGMTALGLHLGRRLGHLIETRAELLGGAVLILIGGRILWEHLVV